jgi:hypothetical protein
MTPPAKHSSNSLRALLKKTPVYAGFKQLGHYPDFWWWKLRGEPRRIPHLLKQRTVIEYATAFGLTTLAETGTYYGEMVAAVAFRFKKIFSIEIDSRLASLAQNRFRKYPNIEIIQGDSQTMVSSVLQRLSERCLWWLDAGYYGWGGQFGNPNRLGTELNAILSDRIPDHVILMDDADGLNGQGGAPTLEEMMASLRANYPNRQVEVARNIIRITPR